MKHDIQLADPKARLRIILFIIVVTIIGGALILAIENRTNEIQSWLELGIRSAAGRPGLTALAIAVFLAPIGLIATYVFFVAVKIANAQRFPVPGTKVIRDTKILTGRAAVRHARIIQLLVLVVVAATLMLGINLWTMLQDLLS